MDRFNSCEEVKWNKGAFDDGFKARMDERPLSDCPKDGSDFYEKSWRAGWSDADQCISSGDFDEFKRSLTKTSP